MKPSVLIIRNKCSSARYFIRVELNFNGNYSPEMKKFRHALRRSSFKYDGFGTYAKDYCTVQYTMDRFNTDLEIIKKFLPKENVKFANLVAA